ncbi:MAG: allophanate hydrolase [bacterium]
MHPSNVQDTPAVTATARVRRAYARIAEADRPEVWIALRPASAALADAAAVDERVAAGEALPLAGLTLAVKDNVDVAGLPTTAGCPAFAYDPAASAPAVQRLTDAGAVVLGKTNLDQFATGLVGTRSPYGAVRDARRPERISGGSSSGSAVAVALGIADIALGTDTAGSGRVPAAFQGIVGIKPTRGLVPTDGVVPACRTLDCVTIFARELALAERAMALMTTPAGRAWPADAPLGAPPAARVAVPRALPGLSAEAGAAFAAAAGRLAAAGAELVEIDLEPFLAAARLLYQGAFVAERHAAVGPFVDAHREQVDPTVGAIIAAAGTLPAHALVTDTERLDALRAVAEAELDGADALLVPTAPRHPTLAEVAADPVGVNTELGTYTNFANLLDLCGVAVPAGEADGGHFGVTVLARAFADRVAADVAGLLAGPAEPAGGPPGVEVFVVGAHRAGQPLNGELTARGARLVRTATTSAEYRLHRLDTQPPKPGLLRVGDGGARIEGELWALPPAGLGDLLAALPAPMALGRVRLADGARPVGFLCEPAALGDAQDITAFGSWPAYLDAAAALAP